MGCSKPGFTHSRYQLQKSSQISEYKIFNASLSLNSFNNASICFFTSFKRFSNHSTAKLFSFISTVFDSHIFTNFNAFQILLLKFLPCSRLASSNNKSFPAGEEIIIPKRTASAPYLSISSNKSGELPRLLLIFLPCLSRTIPVKYTSLNGFFSSDLTNSNPAMIILATQKKIISCPVTNTEVG